MLRLGTVNSTAELECRYALCSSYPLESIERLTERAQLVLNLAGRRIALDPSNPTQDPNAKRRIMANPEDGYLLTKDDKAIHIKAEMRYNITDANRYVFGFHEPEALLELMLENALTHVIRRYDFEDIRLESKTIEKNIEAHLKARMTTYDLGVAITKDSVSLDFGDGKSLGHIPAFARESWDLYTSAKPDKSTILAKANNVVEDMTGTVKSEVNQMLDTEKEVRLRLELLNRVASQHAVSLKTIQMQIASRHGCARFTTRLFKSWQVILN